MLEAGANVWSCARRASGRQSHTAVAATRGEREHERAFQRRRSCWAWGRGETDLQGILACDTLDFAFVVRLIRELNVHFLRHAKAAFERRCAQPRKAKSVPYLSQISA